MLLAIVRGAEGDDLRRRHVLERELRRGRRFLPTAPAARAGYRQSRLRLAQPWHRAATRPGAGRPNARGQALRVPCRHSPGRVAEAGRWARGRDPCRDRRSPAPPRHRASPRGRLRRGRTGSAALRSLARLSTAARSPLISSLARCSRSSWSSSSWVAVSTARIVTGAGPSSRSGRPARNVAIARANRRSAQGSISQISGTWSDGRSQFRHGSSTLWALR